MDGGSRLGAIQGPRSLCLCIRYMVRHHEAINNTQRAGTAIQNNP